MKRRDFLRSSSLAALSSGTGGNAFASTRRLWFALPATPPRMLPHPIILPVPVEVAGVAHPSVSLDGAWQISVDGAGALPQSAAAGTWKVVEVPGQADTQGVPIQRGKGYVYRRRVGVPADFAGSRIFLRFAGASGTCQLYVNGHSVEGHRGGFTVWNREVTTLVTPGSQADILVSLTDPEYDHWPSGFDVGGLLRSVTLLAVPKDCVTRLHAATVFDAQYRNATLVLQTGVGFTEGTSAQIDLELQAPGGEPVMSGQTVHVSREQPEVETRVQVAAPLHWDAEHPHLYKLTAKLLVDGKHVETVERSVGFRTIETRGNKLLVNGMEVKLRGGGRFDSDPHRGHSLTAEQCEEEVRFFKEANLNYIRPACWPAMEAYLDACDRLGMYVEGETSVSFSHGPESMSALASLFVDQAAEMLERCRTHPCILLWSLGNESNYGPNIHKEFEYVRQSDPSRPILFSWSHGMAQGDPLPYNVYSYHYPDISVDMGKPGVATFNGDGKLWLTVPPMPVLHDEFAHLPCYDRDELRRDPNVRNFWGESIRLFWEKMYTTEGCLGGAVWALVDDNDKGSKAYQWGILDLYRRKRPEYWLLRKAYSPIRLGPATMAGGHAEPTLHIPVSNWFCHTNLQEVQVHWKAGSATGTLELSPTPPNGKTMLVVPAEALQDANGVELTFLHNGLQVEETHIKFEAPDKSQQPVLASPAITASGHVLKLTHANQALSINTSTGVTEVALQEQPFILGGPSWHLSGADLPAWQVTAVEAQPGDGGTAIAVSGHLGKDVAVRFHLTFEQDGWMRWTWTLDRFTLPIPTLRYKPWNDPDAGGFAEVGFSLLVSADADLFAWKRRALYTVYPEDHIGRPQGVAKRSSGVPPRRFGETPKVSWSLDEQDFDLYGVDDPGGRGTNDFRSTKEYIQHARVISSVRGVALDMEANGEPGIRLQPEADGVRVFVLQRWNYNRLGNGNYMRPPVSPAHGDEGTVRLRLVRLKA